MLGRPKTQFLSVACGITCIRVTCVAGAVCAEKGRRKGPVKRLLPRPHSKPTEAKFLVLSPWNTQAAQVIAKGTKV